MARHLGENRCLRLYKALDAYQDEVKGYYYNNQIEVNLEKRPIDNPLRSAFLFSLFHSFFLFLLSFLVR